MFEALLHFLGNQCYGMLTTTQVLLERLGGIQLESVVAHELPCLGKRILATSELEVVDIDAQDDLQMRVEIKALLSKNTLKSKVEKSL